MAGAPHSLLAAQGTPKNAVFYIFNEKAFKLFVNCLTKKIAINEVLN